MSPPDPSPDKNASQNPLAALLLAAVPHLRRLGLAHPTAREIVEATGAGRSRAYQLAALLEGSLGELAKPMGRPRAPKPPPLTDTSRLSQEALEYVIAHPGAVTPSRTRRRYSDGFRALALRLVTEHPSLSRAQVAEAIGVPAATVDDWWGMREELTTAAADPKPEPKSAGDAVHESRLTAVLHLWKRWDGSFSAFADAVRNDLEIPWGDTRISTVLSLYSDRAATRRPGRRPDEKALRGAFQTFFPGAQWTADGTALALTMNGERFDFSFELAVDTCTAALVGGHVSPEETAAAVEGAFKDGVITTGAPPLALNTDNATENDAAAASEALRNTLHIRATRGRPQNDAHVEGAFGLFQSVAPPLVVNGRTPRELASAILVLVLTTWGRTLNHRPRESRGGKSRVELYREANPTPEEVEAAREALRALQAAHDQAEQTRRYRADPIARAALDAFFLEHKWDDPDGNLRDAIAGYGADATLAAIAAWRAKETTARLPENVAPRYLLGIARNIQGRAELIAMGRELYHRRREAGDLIVARLELERQALEGSLDARLDTALQRLVRATSQLQRIAWTTTVTDLIRSANEDSRTTLHERTITTIAAAFALDKPIRADLIRAIATGVAPTTD